MIYINCSQENNSVRDPMHGWVIGKEKKILTAVSNKFNTPFTIRAIRRDFKP